MGKEMSPDRVGKQDIVEVTEDVAERKKSEEQNRQFQEYLQLHIDRVPIALIVWDTEFRVKTWNPAATRVFGFSEKEALGKHLYDFIVPKQAQPHVDEIWHQLLKGDETAHSVDENVTKDGRTITCAWTNTPLKRDDGTIIGVLSMIQDITERKKMDDMLRESEEKYRVLVENSPNLVVILQDNVVKYVNRSMCERLGWTFEEMTSPSFDIFDKIPERFHGLVRENMKKKLSGEGIPPYEIYIKTRNGLEVPVEVRSQRITYQGKPALEAILSDRTVFKQTEDALRESEERYRALMDEAPISVCNVDLRGRVTYVNKRFEDISGYSRGEVVGKNGWKLCMFPDETLEILRKRRKGLLMGKPPRLLETRFKCRDGRWIWVDMEGKVIKKWGVPVGFQLISRDITERKKAEEALKESENYLKTILDSIFSGVVVVDEKTREILHANLKALETMGASREQVIGKVCHSFICPAEKGKCPISDLGQTVDRSERVLLRANGERIPILKTVTTTMLRDHKCLIESFVDITERKRMEEELRRYSEHLEDLVEERTRELMEAERLATIGETATMVGHDLRNPLQVITNAVYVLRESAKEVDSAIKQYEGILDLLPEPIRVTIPPYVTKIIEERNEMIRIIDESVNYANKIVSDLQDYARPLKPETVETSLHELINETLSTSEVPETVKVSLIIPEGFPKLMIDPALMRRVFTNLVTNALQAMPSGGCLTIRASKTKDTVSISVQDTGVGIPKENLDKLFKPLFTTRSKGTGFGLAVSKRFAEVHGGTITVESEVGKGSTFTVKIPLGKEAS